MITVSSYLMGIPPGNENPEKPAIIKNFINGVNACGDKGVVVTGWQAIDTDVAVIQGFVHPGSKNVPHLRLRRQVMDNQIKRGKRSIIVDANLFLYADPGNSNGYLRYSYDGIFPTTGEYCYDNPDPQRWDQLRKDLKIHVKDWNLTKGSYILLCTQRDGGWSMDQKPVIDWILQTVNQIRHHSDREIVIRFHPGDKNVREHVRSLAKYRISNLRLTRNKDIKDDFKDAWAVINHNSSPAVASVIEGIPTWQTDAIRSQALDVVHTDFAEIESPREFDRLPWLRKMAQCHWTLDELSSGVAWRHLRKYAIKETE